MFQSLEGSCCGYSLPEVIRGLWFLLAPHGLAPKNMRDPKTKQQTIFCICREEPQSPGSNTISLCMTSILIGVQHSGSRSLPFRLINRCFPALCSTNRESEASQSTADPFLPHCPVQPICIENNCGNNSQGHQLVGVSISISG